MSDQKRQESSRISHYAVGNKLIPHEPYLLPERTWVVLRDALMRGDWASWDEWMHQNASHPDTPSIAELRSALWRGGLPEQAIRDLVLMVLLARERVIQEIREEIKTVDALPEDYEPRNLKNITPDDLLRLLQSGSLNPPKPAPPRPASFGGAGFTPFGGAKPTSGTPSRFGTPPTRFGSSPFTPSKPETPDSDNTTDDSSSSSPTRFGSLGTSGSGSRFGFTGRFGAPSDDKPSESRPFGGSRFGGGFVPPINDDDDDDDDIDDDDDVAYEIDIDDDDDDPFSTSTNSRPMFGGFRPTTSASTGETSPLAGLTGRFGALGNTTQPKNAVDRLEELRRQSRENDDNNRTGTWLDHLPIFANGQAGEPLMIFLLLINLLMMIMLFFLLFRQGAA